MQVGVHVGFGVEITVSWNKKEHHLLGYFPSSSWKNDELSPELQVLQVCAQWWCLGRGQESVCMLGLFPPTDAWLPAARCCVQLACARVKESRERRNQAMVAFLNELLQVCGCTDAWATAVEAVSFCVPRGSDPCMALCGKGTRGWNLLSICGTASSVRTINSEGGRRVGPHPCCPHRGARVVAILMHVFVSRFVGCASI